MKETYIKAAVALIDSGMPVSKVLSGLRTTLKRRGHERLYPRILLGIEKIAESKENEKKTEVHVVKHQSLKVLESKIKSDIKLFSFEDDYEVVEDENLIGGYLLKNNEQCVDKSYRSRLLTLYRSFI